MLDHGRTKHNIEEIIRERQSPVFRYHDRNETVFGCRIVYRLTDISHINVIRQDWRPRHNIAHVRPIATAKIKQTHVGGKIE